MNHRRHVRLRSSERPRPPTLADSNVLTLPVQPEREVLPGVTTRDMTTALDAIEAWHQGRSNKAVRIIQAAAAKGAVPGLVAALVWVTTEVLNEYAGEHATEWQALLRARIEAPASEGTVL